MGVAKGMVVVVVVVVGNVWIGDENTTVCYQ
jgi:hypothetical protein